MSATTTKKKASQLSPRKEIMCDKGRSFSTQVHHNSLIRNEESKHMQCKQEKLVKHMIKMKILKSKDSFGLAFKKMKKQLV